VINASAGSVECPTKELNKSVQPLTESRGGIFVIINWLLGRQLKNK
jgi:hypothetical protein